LGPTRSEIREWVVNEMAPYTVSSFLDQPQLHHPR
jgi:hypothetical protein